MIRRESDVTGSAPPTPPPSTPYTQKLFKSNLNIVVNISCKFHNCLIILTPLSKYSVANRQVLLSWSVVIRRESVATGSAPPAPPPRTPYTQKLFKSIVNIVVNISCKFHSYLKISTWLKMHLIHEKTLGLSLIRLDGLSWSAQDSPGKKLWRAISPWDQNSTHPADQCFKSTFLHANIWSLTHWGLVAHIRISKLDHHWYRQWLVACSAPSHYLNQCWYTVKWTTGNTFRWNFNKNCNIFIQENEF